MLIFFTKLIYKEDLRGMDEDITENSKISGIQFVADFNSLVVCTKEGAIVQILIEENKKEVVGVLDSGIFCMSWSPDNEIFVLATGNSTLVSMSNEFDIINEVPAAPKGNEQFGKIESMEISWRGDGKRN